MLSFRTDRIILWMSWTMRVSHRHILNSLPLWGSRSRIHCLSSTEHAWINIIFSCRFKCVWIMFLYMNLGWICWNIFIAYIYEYYNYNFNYKIKTRYLKRHFLNISGPNTFDLGNGNASEMETVTERQCNKKA